MSSPPLPSDDPAALRRALMLAQVSLMELGDEREAAATRLALLERTLTETQALANLKITERDHLAQVAAGLEDQARALTTHLAEVRIGLRQAQTRVAELQAALSAGEQLASDRLDRIGELETTVLALKSSRSWRWTAPLRSIERLFRRHS